MTRSRDNDQGPQARYQTLPAYYHDPRFIYQLTDAKFQGTIFCPDITLARYTTGSPKDLLIKYLPFVSAYYATCAPNNFQYFLI